VCSHRWDLKPAGRPSPHCHGGNGPPSATRRLRGGGAVVDTKNIECHVNSSTCRVYVNSFYSTIYISFYKYAAATVPTHFVHFLRFSTVCHSAFYRSYRSTAPPFFYIAFLRTFSYTYAPAQLSLQSQASTYVPFGLISSHTISEKIYILHLFLHLRLRLWPSLYVYSGPSLALFSKWQRVHGYTSLIRPRLHPSLHATSTFREHFSYVTLVSTSTPAFLAFTLHLQRPITCLVFKVAKNAIYYHLQGGSDISGTVSKLRHCIKKSYFFIDYFAPNCLSCLLNHKLKQKDTYPPPTCPRNRYTYLLGYT
jgi:hypothetical protein